MGACFFGCAVHVLGVLCVDEDEVTGEKDGGDDADGPDVNCTCVAADVERRAVLGVDFPGSLLMRFKRQRDTHTERYSRLSRHGRTCAKRRRGGLEEKRTPFAWRDQSR